MRIHLILKNKSNERVVVVKDETMFIDSNNTTKTMNVTKVFAGHASTPAHQSYCVKEEERGIYAGTYEVTKSQFDKIIKDADNRGILVEK